MLIISWNGEDYGPNDEDFDWKKAKPIKPSGSNPMLGLTVSQIVVSIISALVLSLLGYCVVKMRKKIREVWLGFCTSRHFLKRIVKTGFTNFYVGRDEWLKYRTPPRLPDYIRQAKHSVKIVCYWMAQGTLEGIPKICADLAQNGINVEIAMIDPNSSLPLILSSDMQMSHEAIRSHIQTSLEQFAAIREELDLPVRERYIIKVSPSVPQAAIILLDSGKESGRIQMEFRLYRSPRSDSFSIELSASSKSKLYFMVERAWLGYLKDAKQV